MARVRIEWTAAPGASAYTVHRSTSAGAQGTAIGTSTTTSYMDETAASGATYWYGVTASNVAGEGPLSAQDQVVIPPSSSSSVSYIPPLTTFTNRFGTWTLVGGVPMLNGTPTNTSGITLLELVNDDVFASNGTFWSQYFDNDVFGTGWGPLSYFTSSQDPADFILAPDLPYVGPSNAADGWTLELTGWPAIYARLSQTIDQAHNPNNAEFLADSNGISYLRFTNDPRYFNTSYDGTVLLAWFLSLGPNNNDSNVPFTARNMRWLLWIEDDVATGMDEAAVKLPGLTNDRVGGPGTIATDSIKWREIHRFPMGNTYMYASLPECAENYIPGTPWEGGGGGAPIVNAEYGGNVIMLKPGRWHCMEQRIVLNTVGQADGYAAMWLNGNLVLERTNVIWRTDAGTLGLYSAFINFYHGGLISPSSLMHYRLAKVATSSSYIGVPSELLSPSPPTSYPAWRNSSWAVGSVNQVPNTAQLNGNMPISSPAVYPTTWGQNSYDIITWNGFAADDNGMWGVAMGGHNGQWSNKVFYIDMTADSPQFNLVNKGSDPRDYSPGANYNFVTGTYPIPSAADANTLYYYYDGLPCARHSYYANIHVAARNRVFMFYCVANFGSAPNAAANVDGFNTVTSLYDPAGTWANHGLADGRRYTAAKHPTTEDVYIGGGNVFKKWTQATATWSNIVPTGLYNGSWESRGTVVDSTRNAWVAIFDGHMQSVNLTTMATTVTTITDPSGNYAADNALDLYGGTALLYDPDNDRYILFLGLTDTVTEYAPGRIYSINPSTSVATRIATVPAPANGWMTRAHYFDALGGIVFCPDYGINLQFLATR